jgi:hypothetical protein
MHFEYEITADDFVAGQILYNRLNRGSRRLRLRDNPIAWILIGIFVILVAWSEGHLNWAPLLITALGAWLIYAGLVSLFPARYYRRLYRKTEMWGKKYIAEINDDGLEVTADACSWRAAWAGVKVKGENEKVFIAYSANTIFIFGKQYLNASQQQELRTLISIH